MGCNACGMAGPCVQRDDYEVELAGMGKKAVLLTVAWDDAEGTFDVVEAYFDRICEYMRFEDCGRVAGAGCGTTSMTRATRYPREAYELGKSL